MLASSKQWCHCYLEFCLPKSWRFLVYVIPRGVGKVSFLLYKYHCLLLKSRQRVNKSPSSGQSQNSKVWNKFWFWAHLEIVQFRWQSRGCAHMGRWLKQILQAWSRFAGRQAPKHGETTTLQLSVLVTHRFSCWLVNTVVSRFSGLITLSSQKSPLNRITPMISFDYWTTCCDSVPFSVVPETTVGGDFMLWQGQSHQPRIKPLACQQN